MYSSARRCNHQTQLQVDFPNVGTAFNIGTVIDFSDQHHLLVSAGRSIDGPTIFQCYVAYQFTFDNSLFQFGSKPEGECGQMNPTAGSAFGLARGGHDAGSQADGAVCFKL